MTDSAAELPVVVIEAALSLLGKLVVAVLVSLVKPSEAEMEALIEPSDAITGSTVATVDSLAGTELTMKLGSYAESEAVISETIADTGAAVVSEPEEIKVAFPSPSTLVICNRVPVEMAEVAGAVPATPVKVIPEAILVGMAEASVLRAEAYEAGDASDKLWSSEVPEGDVVAAVPMAPDRDIPSASVVVAAELTLLSREDPDET
jgi:hypothetical protein